VEGHTLAMKPRQHTLALRNSVAKLADDREAVKRRAMLCCYVRLSSENRGFAPSLVGALVMCVARAQGLQRAMLDAMIVLSLT
jgi:hypothetical protein